MNTYGTVLLAKTVPIIAKAILYFSILASLRTTYTIVAENNEP